MFQTTSALETTFSGFVLKSWIEFKRSVVLCKEVSIS